MSSATVKDFSLLLDAVKEGERCQYTAALFDGWPEEGQRLFEETLDRPFYEIVSTALTASSDEDCGAALFDWVFPPNSQRRETFLYRCEEVGQQGNSLRLWVQVGSNVITLLWEFSLLESEANASWEGFWVREWADEADRPSQVRSPFLSLNPWIHILRRPPGVSVRRRFTVPGKLNVLIVVSNPPPPGSTEWGHIENLEREDGSGMFLRVYRPFALHWGIGWVYPLRNPTKVGIARCIREHKPHVVIYLGHGYSEPSGSGLVLAVTEGGKDFEQVSGLCKLQESELEQVLAGKWQALENPCAHDEGLSQEERPRLFIAFACEAAPAAPALLRCGVPAVLAMRRKIPDSKDTEVMVKYCADVITDESKSIEEAVCDLRQFLKAQEPRFADLGLHFSVPVLHLAPAGTIPVNR